MQELGQNYTNLSRLTQEATVTRRASVERGEKKLSKITRRGHFVNKLSSRATIVILRYFDDAHGVSAHLFDNVFTLGNSTTRRFGYDILVCVYGAFKLLTKNTFWVFVLFVSPVRVAQRVCLELDGMSRYFVYSQ